MEVSDLVNLDSDSFWEWWSGAAIKNANEEFKPIVVEVHGSTKPFIFKI